jgi:hypothetical protein
VDARPWNICQLTPIMGRAPENVRKEMENMIHHRRALLQETEETPSE